MKCVSAGWWTPFNKTMSEIRIRQRESICFACPYSYKLMLRFADNLKSIKSLITTEDERSIVCFMYFDRNKHSNADEMNVSCILRLWVPQPPTLMSISIWTSLMVCDAFEQWDQSNLMDVNSVQFTHLFQCSSIYFVEFIPLSVAQTGKHPFRT